MGVMRRGFGGCCGGRNRMIGCIRRVGFVLKGFFLQSIQDTLGFCFRNRECGTRWRIFGHLQQAFEVALFG